MAAIYMWFVSTETILTTTLYPIEIIEGVQITPSLIQMAMYGMPEDTINSGFSFVSATMRVLLKETGPYEDTINSGFVFVSAEMRQLLKTTGPYEDTINSGFVFVGAEMDQILIETQIPAHGVDLTPSLLTLNMVNV